MTTLSTFGPPRPRVTETAPATLPGHTLMFRESFSALGTVASGTPYGFTSVSGTGYARPGGPRGTGFLTQPGWSMRVPSRQKVSGLPTTIFRGEKDLTVLSGVATLGLVGVWVRVAGVDINKSSILEILNDSVTPLFSVTARRTSFGARTLEFGGTNTAGVTTVTVGRLDTWIYLAAVWEVPNGNGLSTNTFNCYYMLLGESAPTLISSGQAGGNPVYIPKIARIKAIFSDFATVDPWYGAVGGFSIYKTATLADGALYPTDIIRPTEQQLGWYVAPSTGNNSNSGYGLSNAWLTKAKLLTEIDIGTIFAGDDEWVDQNGVTNGLSGLTDSITMGVWWDAYKINNRRLVRGDRIYIHDSTLMSLPNENDINLENLPGVSFWGSGAAPKISARVNLAGQTWVQPDPTNFSDVWKFAVTNMRRNNTGALVAENNRLMTPVVAANETAAIPLLTAGKTWVDSTGILIHAFGSTNPNTDGKTRTCGAKWNQTGTSPGLVAMGSGELRDITIDVGPFGPMTADDVEAFYCWSASTDRITIIRNVNGIGGTKHQGGIVGNGTVGLVARWNVNYEAGCVSAGFTMDVGYTGYQGGAAMHGNIWDTCTTTPGAAYHFLGELPSDGAAQGTFLYTHGNAATGNLFVYSNVRNCNVSGLLNFSLHSVAAVYITDSTFDQFGNDSNGTNCDRSTLRTPRINIFAGGTSTFTNCNIFDELGTLWGGDCEMAGTLVLNRCTFDLSNYAFGSSGGAVWGDDGNFALQITNSAIIATSGGEAILSINAETTDSIMIHHCAFLGHTDPTVLGNYNDGATTAARTYGEAVTLGIISTSVASASVGLDSGNDYAVQAGSPVIGVAVAGNNVEDFTGTVHPVRDDAASRELAV